MPANDFYLRYAAATFDDVPQLQSVGAELPARMLASWCQELARQYADLVRNPVDRVITFSPLSKYPSSFMVEVRPLETQQRVQELILTPVKPPAPEETMPLSTGPDAEPPPETRPHPEPGILAPQHDAPVLTAWSRGLVLELRALLAGVTLSAEERAVLEGCLARFNLFSEQPSSALALVLFAGFCDRSAALASAEGRHRDAEINAAVTQLLDELAGSLLAHQRSRLPPAAADDRMPRVTQLVGLLWQRLTGAGEAPVYRVAPRLRHPV